jgi:hypothetical protein
MPIPCNPFIGASSQQTDTWSDMQHSAGGWKGHTGQSGHGLDLGAGATDAEDGNFRAHICPPNEYIASHVTYRHHDMRCYHVAFSGVSWSVVAPSWGSNGAGQAGEVQWRHHFTVVPLNDRDAA